MYWGLGKEARVVSAWIAVDDSSPDNGCMRAVRIQTAFAASRACLCALTQPSCTR